MNHLQLFLYSTKLCARHARNASRTTDSPPIPAIGGYLDARASAEPSPRFCATLPRSTPSMAHALPDMLPEAVANAGGMACQWSVLDSTGTELPSEARSQGVRAC